MVSRMTNKILAFILVMLSLIMLSACSEDAQKAHEPLSAVVPSPKLPEIDGMGYSYGIPPVTITRSQTTVDKSIIFYPGIVGDGAKSLNDAIYASIVACIKYVNSPIYTYYGIKYNKNNILSILISYNLVSNDQAVFLLPLNFYVDCAQTVSISDCLNSQDESWRNNISSIIAKQAEEKKITLLGNIPAVSDSQLFYFDDGGITLVFRPYEISTYSPASPEFSFTLDELNAYIAPGSPLFEEAVNK